MKKKKKKKKGEDLKYVLNTGGEMVQVAELNFKSWLKDTMLKNDISTTSEKENPPYRS